MEVLDSSLLLNNLNVSRVDAVHQMMDMNTRFSSTQGWESVSWRIGTITVVPHRCTIAQMLDYCAMKQFLSHGVLQKMFLSGCETNSQLEGNNSFCLDNTI